MCCILERRLVPMPSRRLWLYATAAIVLILLFGHNVTCLFSVSACSSLPLTLSRLLIGFTSSYGLPSTNIDPSRLEQPSSLDCAQYNHRQPAHRAQWVVVLSTAISGSTFFIRSLANDRLHVRQHDEALLDWSRECNGHWDVSSCSFQAMMARLATAWIDKTPDFVEHTLVKIQYDHIPEQYLADFASFCHCNNVSVVHLIRQSSLESFWTSQAQVMDVAQRGGKLQDRIYHNSQRDDLKSNQMQLTLPVSATLKYVAAIRKRREAYRLLLHWSPHRIAYHEVYYEDLTGPFGQRTYNAAQQFLGMPLTTLSSAGLVRVHPGRCSAKIANWEVLRKALLQAQRTDLVRACELPPTEINVRRVFANHSAMRHKARFAKKRGRAFA
eukprot:TRINITY_DN5976_c0_g1_i2.p1 TRINITY_DN5976_c0_g1~~TRINITY_DN5976_c0_g1_i2.p1  ORF type:complete len:384 (+),score=74.37 TRINITY_DN5976_c0_g1_i2:65-1216(+)